MSIQGRLLPRRHGFSLWLWQYECGEIGELGSITSLANSSVKFAGLTVYAQS